MNAQSFFTYTFDLIAFGYAAFILFDFIDRIGGEIWDIFSPEHTLQQDDMPRLTKVSPGQLSLFDLQPEAILQLPDPWTLPDDNAVEFPTQPYKPVQQQQKPLLLLPQAKAISRQPSLPVTAQPSLDELLANLDLDTLQLRPARKIAKALGVAQKVNKRDQPVGFLRAQIKAKLQRHQELPPETINALKRELLAS